MMQTVFANIFGNDKLFALPTISSDIETIGGLCIFLALLKCLQTVSVIRYLICSLEFFWKQIFICIWPLEDKDVCKYTHEFALDSYPSRFEL